MNHQQYRALYLGRSGSGKKTAACSFPGKIKYLDIDGRIGGLLGSDWINLNLIDVEQYGPKLPNFASAINKELDKIVDADAKGSPEFDMVVLGSLTGFARSLMAYSLPLTHSSAKATEKKGKFIGDVAISGPDDYNYEKVVVNQVLSAVRQLKNTSFIITGHVVATYGKADPNNPYSETVEKGEKLNMTDKLGESAIIYFDEIYGFLKERVGNKGVDHKVCFRSELYRTKYKNAPNGYVEINNGSFYDKLAKYM